MRTSTGVPIEKMPSLPLGFEYCTPRSTPSSCLGFSMLCCAVAIAGTSASAATSVPLSLRIRVPSKGAGHVPCCNRTVRPPHQERQHRDRVPTPDWAENASHEPYKKPPAERSPPGALQSTQLRAYLPPNRMPARIGRNVVELPLVLTLTNFPSTKRRV